MKVPTTSPKSNRLQTPALDCWRDRVARRRPVSAGLLAAAQWEAAAIAALGDRLPNARARAEDYLERAAAAVDPAADAAAFLELGMFAKKQAKTAPPKDTPLGPAPLSAARRDLQRGLERRRPVTP